MVTQCPACKAPVGPNHSHCGQCGMKLGTTGTPVPSGSGAGLTTKVAMPYAVQQVAARPLRTGMLIGGRYRLEALVGRGAMGEVWRGRDENLGMRLRAIKRVLAGGATPGEQAERQTWIKREADTLAALRHPAICDIYDVMQEDGDWYLILEWIEGRTLAEELESRGTPGLPPAEVFGWAAILGSALDYLHGQQPPVVFRDIKPQNIMRCQDGTVKLIDFGIARPMTATSGTVIGTPGYAPPEQYQGQADARSDEYALAATVYHLLTGRDPTKHDPFSFPPARSLLPALSAKQESALTRALSMKPADRFATLGEFSAALGGATPKVMPRPTPTPLPKPAPTPRAPSSAWRMVVLGASASALLGCLLPWWGSVDFGVPSWSNYAYSGPSQNITSQLTFRQTGWWHNIADPSFYNWHGVLALLMVLTAGLAVLVGERRMRAGGGRTRARLVVGASVVGVIAVLLLPGSVYSGWTTDGLFTGTTAFGGFLLGFWLTLVCLVVMAVGGVLMWITASRAPAP